MAPLDHSPALMKRCVLLGLFSALCASSIKAQSSPVGVWLEWSNVAVTLYPDSGGVFVWTQIHGNPRTPTPHFSGSFEPAKLDEWLAAARGFNTQSLDATDTATLRSSSP